MTSQLDPYLLLPGQGVAGFDAAVKASRISTGGNLSVIESHTKGGAPWHVHTREDEYFYVVEGTIIVHCGTEVWQAGPRSFVFLPRGIPHAWDVGGAGVATLLRDQMPDLYHSFHANHDLIFDFLRINAYIPEVAKAFTDAWRRTTQSSHRDVLNAFATADETLNGGGISPIPTKWYQKLRTGAASFKAM